MEDLSEQSHWASPSLLSSDPLAAFSSESGLLPPGDDGEVFFSGPDADYTGLPSFFSNPSHGRAPPAYRHGAVRPLFTSPGLLSNLQLLDGPGGHSSLSSAYGHPASAWSGGGGGPLTKTPLHSHAPTSLYSPCGWEAADRLSRRPQTPAASTCCWRRRAPTPCQLAGDGVAVFTSAVMTPELK
ncbi:hypothetical protein EYF80_022437 [Liparis tanakae]|uniref:Uncharacterized protein n=1 Tax=Liparis tanakae TaxID=230148 RepID=A0A4Z2HP23_9TELE|nr:hypothetical protein EYF80_022437 [Liparis tanakae]